MSRFLQFLPLLRYPNLPTVWTDVVAGALLAGALGVPWWALAGCSFLYLGGMLLNDAWDAPWDAAHRPERPIPSGAVSRRSVWILGFGLMGAGAAAVAVVSPWIVVALVCCIVAYEVCHKRAGSLGVVLMGACRACCVLAGACSATGMTIGDRPCIAAVGLGCYVAALCGLAREEVSSEKRPITAFRAWPLFLPAAVGCALHGASVASVLCGAVLVGWLVWVLRGAERGRMVGDLISGIALVDLVQSSPENALLVAFFGACFLLCLRLRRFAPQT